MKKGEELKPFGEYIFLIGRANDLFNVFDDFLRLVVCVLSNKQKETEYKEIISKYPPDEQMLFSTAFASLVNEMDNSGEGLKDVLGGFFEEHFSDAKNGQFFTPESVSDLTAILTIGAEGKHVSDCCCGSGRLFLSAAKIDRNRYFFGTDISKTCCLMSLINLCLNSIRGEITWGNSLTLESWGKWLICVDYITKVPFIYEVDPKMTANLTEEELVFFPVEEAEIVVPNNGKRNKTSFRRFKRS